MCIFIKSQVLLLISYRRRLTELQKFFSESVCYAVMNVSVGVKRIVISKRHFLCSENDLFVYV